jgi:hypothetical protein
MPEPLIRLLAQLPSSELDPARAERIRMRCRTRLEAAAARPLYARLPAAPGRMAQLWQPLIAVLGCAYLTEVIVEALRVYAF